MNAFTFFGRDVGQNDGLQTGLRFSLSRRNENVRKHEFAKNVSIRIKKQHKTGNRKRSAGTMCRYPIWDLLHAVYNHKSAFLSISSRVPQARPRASKYAFSGLPRACDAAQSA